MELKNRTIIVTGSGSGIGRALALEFFRQGANVVCCGRREERIKETVLLIEKDGTTALASVTDSTQNDQLQSLIELTLDRFGQIDVLYNNAGSFQTIGGIREVDPADWWQDVTVNLLGEMLCCRAVLPHMMQRNEGININMDGGGSTGPLTGGSSYGSSKTALLRFTDTLAADLEVEQSLVVVFALGPGLVRTEMTELQTIPAGQKWIPSTKEILDKNETRPPEDCAQAAVELIRIACPELNGRVFQTGMDFKEVARKITDIKSKEFLTLRFRSFWRNKQY
jgi:NAD(P)-dependent dehydrogenase (short-subunit alcohol dehydrogenase family)